jgi:subtilase family serine protease
MNNTSIPKPNPIHYLPANNQTFKGRAYPDISALAGPHYIVYNGIPRTVAGTSASSPLLGAMFALMNEMQMEEMGKPLGFLNVLLYQMAANTSYQCYNDIADGNNICPAFLACSPKCEGYVAAPGWVST